MGGGGRLPSEILNETNYYLNVRSLILGEMGRIQEYKDKKRKK